MTDWMISDVLYLRFVDDIGQQILFRRFVVWSLKVSCDVLCCPNKRSQMFRELKTLLRNLWPHLFAQQSMIRTELVPCRSRLGSRPARWRASTATWTPPASSGRSSTERPPSAGSSPAQRDSSSHRPHSPMTQGGNAIEMFLAWVLAWKTTVLAWKPTWVLAWKSTWVLA